MNAPIEPKGGTTITTIIALDNKGNPAKVKLKHNGEEFLTDSKGSVNTHINGGEVYLNGIQITRRVQKGVANIFQFDTWTGGYTRINK